MVEGGRMSRDHLVHRPLLQQGHLEQVVLDQVQVVFEYVQG